MCSNEIDIYRDTPLRYLGYANELGESFKKLIPKSLYLASYAAAIGYVLADTRDKALKIKKPSMQFKIAGDVFIWQMLASVMIPGFTINRICHFSRIGLRRSSAFRNFKKNELIISSIGIGSIPLIIHPIDSAVDYLMDSTYRPFVLGKGRYVAGQWVPE